MARRWTPRLLACLAVGAVCLSACSAKTEASESLPSASASPTTPTLTPLGPKEFPVPPEAREKTPVGAITFMKYYMALNAHIADRGPLDPEPLLDLSNNCAYCKMVAMSYDEDRRAKFKYGSFSHTFRPAGPGVIKGDIAEVGFVYSQGAFQVFDSQGRDVDSRSAPASARLQSGAHLTWNEANQTWLVSSMTVG